MEIYKFTKKHKETHRILETGLTVRLLPRDDTRRARSRRVLAHLHRGENIFPLPLKTLPPHLTRFVTRLASHRPSSLG